MALLVTIVGGRVTAGSVTAFRWAWSPAAALTLATALIGVALARAAGPAAGKPAGRNEVSVARRPS